MNPFTKDLVIAWKTVKYRVIRTIDSLDVQLEHALTGAICSVKLDELLADYMKGLLELPRPGCSGAPGRATPRPTVAAVTAQCRADERRRADYIVELSRSGVFEHGRHFVEAEVQRIAAKRGDQFAPHISTIYRWRDKYLEAQEDVRALLSMTHRRGGAGKSRLQAEVEEIIDAKIDSVFLFRKDCSAEELHNAVFLEIQQRNTTRIESEWPKVPSLRTIQRRVRGLGGYELARARYGEREADRAYADLGVARIARHILEVAEIDHTPVDVLVVDEHRRVVGRPTITVMLDRKSRVVLGFHLSLAGHGTDSVFAAIQCALFPKSYLLDRYKALGLRWDCFGWPGTLLMDNGAEFHGDALEDALRNIGVTTEFSKSKDPNSKPFIERFNRSFNYSFIRRLPGATQSRVHKRRGVKAEDEACMTLQELDQAVHTWICSVYHHRPHGGLRGATPMQVWTEGGKSHTPVLRCTLQEVDIEFSHLEERTLHHYGIELNTFRYTSTRLMTLRAMLPMSVKVKVKWPFTNAGHVWVYDSMADEYFKVPNVDPQYEGLTVEQAKLAVRVIGDSPDLKTTRATASAVVDEMVKVAAADKKLKNRKKGQRLANNTSRMTRASAPSDKTPKADKLPAPLAPTAEIDDIVVEQRS